MAIPMFCWQSLRFGADRRPVWGGGAIALAMAAGSVFGADVDPQLVAKGLARPAKQASADYDKVAPADVANCKGEYASRNGTRGLLISGPNGMPLRWLADTNADGKIDQLSFFANGVEVYRDMDTNFNDKIDQSRWMGTSGMRWGVDRDEDGEIDEWKAISAEEVTAEVVEAVRDGDVRRFERVLMSSAELSELGLGQAKASELKERLATAAADFKKLAETQKVIDKSSRWASFGADKPGIVPAGTEDSTADVLVYENVLAVVETAKGPQQLMIGTMVKVDEGWRLIDVPRMVSEGTAVSESSLFFASTGNQRIGSSGGESTAISATMEKLIREMDLIEKKMADPKEDRARLHAQRADLLEKLIESSATRDDAQAWTRQLADQVLSAVQANEYPDGIARLKRLESNIQGSNSAKGEVSYVAYRILTAEYNAAINDKDANFEKVQKEHLENLEKFVDKYPESPDSADAMIQLGLNSELTNDPKAAMRWYQQTEERFPNTPQGEKAHGANLRLNLVGQQIKFDGMTLNGKRFSTEKLNKPVIVHYWATWCGPCKADMQELQKLQAKYARNGLTLVGINTDGDAKQAIQFLGSNKNIDWVQLHEAGGLESRIAVGLGVLSLPVTIVIGKDGKVAHSTSHYTPDLENLIQDLMK